MQREPETIDGIKWERRPTIAVFDSAGRIVRLVKDSEDSFQYTISQRGLLLGPRILQTQPVDLSTLELPPGPYQLKSLVAFDASSVDKLETGRGPKPLATGEGGTIEVTAGASAQVTIPITEVMIDETRKKLAEPVSQPVAAATPQPQAPKNPNPSEWNRVRVRLVDSSKQPLAGIRATLNGFTLSPSEKTRLSATVDQEGLADFGLVRVGRQELQAVDSSGVRLSRGLIVRPGESIEPEIVWPPLPTSVDVGFQSPWPDELRDKPIWTACVLERETETVGGVSWSIPPMIVVLDAAGRVVRSLSDSSNLPPYKISEDRMELSPNVVAAPAQAAATLKLLPGTYHVRNIVIVDTSKIDDLPLGHGLPVVVHIDRGEDITVGAADLVTIALTDRTIDRVRGWLSRQSPSKPAAEN